MPSFFLSSLKDVPVWGEAANTKNSLHSLKLQYNDAPPAAGLTPLNPYPPRCIMPLLRHTEWDACRCLERPIFAPLLSLAQPFCAFKHWPTIGDYNAVLLRDRDIRSEGGASIVFEPQITAKPRRRREPMTLSSVYEGRIYTTGHVPTRPENWHDFFNAIVWAAFPQSKRALNGRHYRAAVSRLEGGSLSGARTREQDALSIVDEGGLVVLCEADVAMDVDAALFQADEHALDCIVRGGRAMSFVLGHALYEHFVMSREMVRAYGVVVTCEGKLPGGIDAQRALADEQLARWIECDEHLREPSGRLGMPLVDERRS